MEPPRSLDERAGEPAVAPPPGNPRFPLMDSLRAIAVGSVFLFHAFDDVTFASAVTAQLSVGVTIFFVISGFLLYRPYVVAHLQGDPGPRLRDFARRRVLRIVPAYWLALGIASLAFGLPGTFSNDAWVYFGFAQSYSSDTLYNGIPIAWSLCVEVAFYVLLPLYAAVALHLVRGARSAVAAEVALLVLVAVAMTAERTAVVATDGFTPFVWATLPGTFLWFALGMGLAIVSAATAQRAAATGTASRGASNLWWVAAAAVYVGLVAYFGKPDRNAFDPAHPPAVSVGDSLILYVGFGLVALCLVVPAVFAPREPALVQRVLAWRWLGWLGLVSYGIFLWHKPLLDEIGRQRNNVLLPGHVAVAALTAIAIAATSYYLVERPLLRFKHRPGERR